ncbi:hypothetical protein [Synechocystis sp. PCC 7509]|uniref:hypothetical protein n=1 Tax=Synechocystis sp. PCC 7509 TaxID=927677 RepID=UPI0002AC3653|nr:hypothetical protein [Synechocystis sp. PCC 7509]
MQRWQAVKGIIERGHQVASGIAKDSPYPRGTIEMQTPFFQKLGLDLSAFFPGTLNIFISPKTFTIQQPEYTFKSVQWHQEYPAEDFSFSPCRVIFQEITYDGLVYYPHPETKTGHFQDPAIVEVLVSSFIPQIHYGDRLILEVNHREILIS